MQVIKAYIQHGKAGQPMITEACECIEKPLWWQLKGLSYTASGYGSKIPTSFMIKHNNRFKRVYCRIFSNSGSLYIMQGKERLYVNIDRV